MFPKSLSRPDDRLESAEQWELLSKRLFDDLLTARHASEPPAPSKLWQEWSKWDDFTPDSGPNIVSKDTVRDWLRAYETSLASERGDASPYVRSVASLLLKGAKAEQVSIVVAQDGRPARVLVLEITAVENGSDSIWLHPAFEHRSADVNAGSGTFARSMSWAWYATHEYEPTLIDIFWRVRAADGGPLPLMKLDGPSASAAAYRAFWHIMYGLHIDSDVYVLADATAAATTDDHHIQAVGHLREKINAINAVRSSLSPYPPTLVAARDVSADDLAALDAAREWAEIRTVATTAELTAVRSCTANTLIAYMENLSEKLDETPWSRDGKPIRLSEVHVPPQVWKDEYAIHPAAEAGPGGERDWRPAGYDPAGADREVAPRLKQQRRKVRVPWTTEFQRPQHQPIVIVGGPGFGKTSLLRWTAREIALESLAAVRARNKDWSEVRWPVVTDLAVWLSKSGDAHDALRDAALGFAALPKTHPALQREALPAAMDARLLTETGHTYLFLDALDQVPAARLRLLRERLDGFAAVASRLVFSTRGAALATHLPFMSFPRLTIFEAAALSTDDACALGAKWLDAKLATRLEAHLRAQPAMSVVADSPLLLTLACGIVARNPDAELPETAACLYRDLMRSLARGEWRDAGSDAVLDPDGLLDRLRLMAWRLFSREAGVNRFSRDTLIRALNGGSSSADAQADAALQQLCHLGFLESSGDSQGEPHFQFRHTTFLEFLAAAHVAAEINAEGWAHAQVPQWHGENGWQAIKVSQMLDANAFEPAWEPLIVFTAGLMKAPLPLIEVLADRKKDDLYRHRLGLLYWCCQSIALEKRVCIEPLLPVLLKELRFMGIKTVFHHPEQRHEWLKHLKLLADVVPSGNDIAQVVVTVALYHSKTHMGGAQDMVEALANPTSIEGAKNCANALLTVFLEPDAHFPFSHRAPQHAVRIAIYFGLPEVFQRMIREIDCGTDRPWLQVILAGALLKCGDMAVAGKAMQVLVGIADNTSVETSQRWEAAVALIHGLEGCAETPLDYPPPIEASQYQRDGGGVESQIEAILARMLLAKHADSASQEVQKQLALRILQIVPRPVTDVRSAIIDLAIKRKLGTGYYEGETFWASDVLKHSHPSIREFGVRHLLERAARKGHEGDYAISFLVHGINKADSEKERDAVTDLLRTKLRSEISDGKMNEAVIKGLSELGVSYEECIRPELLRFVQSGSSDVNHLVEAGEVAKSHGDQKLLSLIVARIFNTVQANQINLGIKDPFQRHDAAKLFFGTEYWPQLEKSAFEYLRNSEPHDSNTAWFGVDAVAYGAMSSSLMNLIPEVLRNGKMNWRPWHKLLRELDRRGWRLRLRGRQIEVLRRGQEEPRAGADFEY